MIDIEKERKLAMSELAIHAELLDGELTYDELKLLGVFGAMKRGFTKAEALEIYQVTEKYYDKNISKALGHPPYEK